MKRRDAISRYVREVAVYVPKDLNGRQQTLEEIESHLRDSASDYERQGGVSRVDAMNHVVEEFGVPSTVAAGFSEPSAVRGVRGVLRWLPLALPVASTVLALFILGSSLVRDGFTLGDQIAARWFALWLAFDLALLAGAYYAIRRADRDRSWRAAAWTCTVLIVVVRILR